MRVEAVYDGAEASRAFGNGEVPVVNMAAVAAAAAATIATGRRHDDAPRGTKAPTRRLAAAAQARDIPPVRWAWTAQARARVLPPKNGVGHGHGADPQLPRRAQHRRRRPEAPRRRACSAPPSTATSSRSSQPADSLRIAQEPAPGTAHLCNGNGKERQQKQRETPKGTCHVHQCARKRAALLTMLPRGPVDVKGRPGRVIPLRGGLGHARVLYKKHLMTTEVIDSASGAQTKAPSRLSLTS